MTSNTTVRSIAVRRRAPDDSAAVPASSGIGKCRTACLNCKLRDLCVPCCALTRSGRDAADRLLFTRQRVRRGDSLYRAGDRFTSLYAVRNGFFKSTAALENGREQVAGFSLAGEVLGLDGIWPEQHGCAAAALEDSEVCAIPFAGLQALAHEIPGLQHHLRKMMSREIAREHGAILQLGCMNAEERLAMFLLDLSRRFAARGCAASEFKLSMSREEIGSYLSLKPETVSRTFSKFQGTGLIGVQQKSIRIRNSAGLAQAMGREPG